MCGNLFFVLIYCTHEIVAGRLHKYFISNFKCKINNQEREGDLESKERKTHRCLDRQFYRRPKIGSLSELQKEKRSTDKEIGTQRKDQYYLSIALEQKAYISGNRKITPISIDSSKQKSLRRTILHSQNFPMVPFSLFIANV